MTIKYEKQNEVERHQVQDMRKKRKRETCREEERKVLAEKR